MRESTLSLDRFQRTVNPTRLRINAAEMPKDSFFGSLVVVVDISSSPVSARKEWGED